VTDITASIERLQLVARDPNADPDARRIARDTLAEVGVRIRMLVRKVERLNIVRLVRVRRPVGRRRPGFRRARRSAAAPPGSSDDPGLSEPARGWLLTLNSVSQRPIVSGTQHDPAGKTGSREVAPPQVTAGRRWLQG
jgi:hypothetical protein